MLALIVCLVAFAATYRAGRRSLGQGLIALFVVGYFYGIVRANLLTVFSHFIFDAGLIGLYLSQEWISSDPKEAKRLETVRLWTAVLIAWPLLVVLMPFQPLLVSIVGLRGNVFFIPVLILGSRLKEKDLLQLSAGLAVLNLVALGFAWIEYFTSVTQFYPLSPVTLIIYSSGDVAGGYFRIPAIFTSAAAYGGNMVGSLPFLLGLWDRSKTQGVRILAVCGVAAAMVGVLMSATRSNFIIGSAMLLVTILTSRMKTSRRMIFVMLIALAGVLAMSNERFQRFKSLADTEMVSDRIAGSVNRTFWEILMEYPMGNGLGGGGTSIPYFLQGQVRNPIGMENVYSQILCEQGVIGLLLWIGFIVWFLSRVRIAFANGPWVTSRRMAWSLNTFLLGTAWVGLGLFTSIPGTVMLLLGMGWTTNPALAEVPQSGGWQTSKVSFEQQRRRPVYT